MLLHLRLVLHLALIFITFTVGITFAVVITFSSDTGPFLLSPKWMSSTYFHMSADVSRSFIIIRKSHGPSLVPCGTPAYTLHHAK